ncbi:phage tail sheath C-terminal domain-containing protein [Paucibacter sp. APW11]|uniref:Phage tail sheath C-terminal domain-containing protein n=1 Tax=Roseateles aquae TaxID=3077235 RepID=A0ABU3P7X9_9BURK|nr:phage tail sheath C-terminal domain-containing protein [Paucibacter sp. APW11]MDT8998198.1 phage tail sheath C-terminal domain-containing protein [Paucibacter sp. APW11]
MAVMKTPGVYIVEKNAFPNSVVEVATAVPAFVGHTEFADNHNTPLSLRPWPISSMAEYHQYFGGPPKPRFALSEEADPLDAQFQALSEPDTPSSKKGYKLAQVKGVAGHDFGLYNALRHFFQNGGGRCYVVSIGSYKQELDPDLFQKGIDALKKEQEPTMLLAPEAVRFEDANTCKDIQQAMLNHCGYEMKNRVAILDVYNGDKPREYPPGDPVAAFRDSLGINFLDFAAAYYPWLNTSVVGEKEVDYENIAPDSLDLLCTLLRAELNLPADRPGAEKPKARAMWDEVAKLKTDFTPIVIAEARKQRDDAAAKQSTAARAKVESEAKAAKKSADEIAAALKTFDDAQAQAKADADKARTDARKAFIDDFVTKAKAADADLTDAAAAEQAETAAKAWDVSYDNPLSSAALADGVKVRRELLNKTLVNASNVFKAVLTEVRRQLNVMPPSSAMAGIYTMVDNTRGVWKAPANVSLNGVISPTVSISHEQQEDLNVSAQGKSINAIRAFIGEGVLVWGARTLDGNSLDWRYINVRRTMIMLEESCRLAAKAMVFEPNTANTWVTIKSMIANFLTSVWKRGGLMGAVPEDAFSVHVGLGETMTPNDILEGILRVTVLVAMVRPAEFIEITFQQQMPKS